MAEDSLYTLLSHKQYDPCLPLDERENLSLKEEQTIYKLRFGIRRNCVAYHIDGYIIEDGYKCDYLILSKQSSDKESNAWQAIFVELKGTDVEHALKQLDATLSNRVFHHKSIDERHARIVAKSFPSSKSNPKFELAKREFKKKHNCSLKQVTSGNPDLIR